MKILIVNQHISNVMGGSERQCHIIAQELNKLGHSVTYAICKPKQELQDMPYNVINLDAPFVRSFSRILDEIRPDVVYWRYNKKNFLGCALASKLKKVKFFFSVSHVHDVTVFSAKPFYNKDLSLLRRSLKAIKYVKDQISSAINFCGFWFIDAVVLQHSGQIRDRISKPYKIIYNSYVETPEITNRISKPYVLWVSNIKQSKNPEIFIKLAGEFSESGCKFIMVGAIQDLGYEHLLNNKLNHPPNFEFLGYQAPEKVEELISNCLFLVHTCSPEGFPNVFIQAWLRAKPVVSLNFDPDNLLTKNNVGFYSGDYASLKIDTKRLIEDEKTRSSMGLHAYEYAVKTFNPVTNVKKLEGYLLSVLSS